MSSSEDRKMTSTHSIVLKVAAVLWIIWALVHIFAGAIIISTPDAAGAVQAVADAVPKAQLAFEAHPAASALYNQHGWNLAWIGAVTAVCAVYLWRAPRSFDWRVAAWVAALIGGMADIGYFVFMDLGGYVNFMPGGLMTYVSAAAILLSGWVWFATRTNGAT
jgi:predicted DCC family thiol-disulfide oxidoreductase YuxK